MKGDGLSFPVAHDLGGESQDDWQDLQSTVKDGMLDGKGNAEAEALVRTGARAPSDSVGERHRWRENGEVV